MASILQAGTGVNKSWNNWARESVSANQKSSIVFRNYSKNLDMRRRGRYVSDFDAVLTCAVTLHPLEPS